MGFYMCMLGGNLGYLFHTNNINFIVSENSYNVLCSCCSGFQSIRKSKQYQRLSKLNDHSHAIWVQSNFSEKKMEMWEDNFMDYGQRTDNDTHKTL